MRPRRSRTISVLYGANHRVSEQLRPADGEAQIFGVDAAADGFMIKKTSGSVICDAIVHVAGVIGMTIIPIGRVTCVSRTELREYLPDATRRRSDGRERRPSLRSLQLIRDLRAELRTNVRPRQSLPQRSTCRAQRRRHLVVCGKDGNDVSGGVAAPGPHRPLP